MLIVVQMWILVIWLVVWLVIWLSLVLCHYLLLMKSKIYQNIINDGTLVYLIVYRVHWWMLLQILSLFELEGEHLIYFNNLKFPKEDDYEVFQWVDNGLYVPTLKLLHNMRQRCMERRHYELRLCRCHILILVLLMVRNHCCLVHLRDLLRNSSNNDRGLICHCLSHDIIFVRWLVLESIIFHWLVIWLGRYFRVLKIVLKHCVNICLVLMPKIENCVKHDIVYRLLSLTYSKVVPCNLVRR